MQNLIEDLLISLHFFKAKQFQSLLIVTGWQFATWVYILVKALSLID